LFNDFEQEAQIGAN